MTFISACSDSDVRSIVTRYHSGCQLWETQIIKNLKEIHGLIIKN